MHIVSTTDSTIKFVPRAYDTSLSVVITDEETNTSSTESLTGTRSKNYMVIDPAYTFKEGRFYTMRVTGSAEVYRGRVFCTDQTDYEKYTVNQGVYTEYNSDNNGYIYR